MYIHAKQPLCHAITLAIIGLITSYGASAQAATNQADNIDALFELSLTELMNINTDISSNIGHPISQQPSIISVVTREQILQSDARDLIDILRMIPGFGFAHDTLGINSWGFRGIWGHEGKIMLLVDGAPQNDAAWGNLIFGKRFPVLLIDKIEIIRGPGAAKYGNYAELAVVRITTIGQNQQGGFSNVRVGAMAGQFSLAEMTSAYGQSYDSGIGFSVSAHTKNARRTTENFSAADGSLSTSQNHSPMDLVYLDGKVSYQGLTLSSLVEHFSFEHNDSLAQIPTPNTTVDQGYHRFHLGLDYQHQYNDQFSLNGKTRYLETLAHDVKVTSSDRFRTGSHYGIDTERSISSLDGTWHFNSQANINIGIEYFNVKAIARSLGDYFFDPLQEIPGTVDDTVDRYFAGSNQYSFHQKSVFFQYEHYSDWLNFTFGARWAAHSATTKAVTVPRFGISKTIGDFGIKLMYAEAFRTGDAEHLNLAATQLAPEELTSDELELSYLTDIGLFKVNFFVTDIKQPIVFNSDAFTDNSGTIGSKGLEASYNDEGAYWTQAITLSLYRGEKDASPAQLANDQRAYLGFPTVKATWQLNYRYSNKTTVTTSLFFENEKYWRVALNDPSQDRKISSTTKLDIAVSHQLTPDIVLHASVHDLFNDGYQFPQAYGQVLYPGDSREITLGLSYEY